MKKISHMKRFISLNELKQKVEDEVGSIDKDEIGYMKPGHGKKGKKQELEDDQDLQDMYTFFKKGCEIILWCYGGVGQPAPTSASKSRKRVRDGESSTAPPNKRDSVTKSISDVESIVKQLQSIHGESYSIEKMNAWAHLIHMGKHSSYQEPPDFPFFRGNKKKTASGHGNPDGDKQVQQVSLWILRPSVWDSERNALTNSLTGIAYTKVEPSPKNNMNN